MQEDSTMAHSPRFEKIAKDARDQITECTLDELLGYKAAADNPWVLIDVREDHEWQTDRIPGAVHIGRGILERDIEKHYPDLNTPLIVYCGGGYRSALAALNLERMGFTQVRSLAGGIRGWRDNGHATDSSPVARD